MKLDALGDEAYFGCRAVRVSSQCDTLGDEVIRVGFGEDVRFQAAFEASSLSG